MADTATACSERDEIAGWLPPPDPSLALNYHFGMLLGVADFQCEQAYFRGKSRLHNAWLHGRGVVWGYEVSFDDPSGEAKVKPGLALDGAGRELLLDAEACASVSAWANDYTKAGTQPALDPNGFDLQVVARVRTCLARPVPAIAVPCADTSKVTAFSRIAERVDIFFRPVPPPAPETSPPPFHRVRLFLGIDDPILKNGTVVPEDQAVLDRQASTAGDPQLRLAAFRQLAALDTLALHPHPPQDGEPFPLFPEPDTAVVLLAVIKGILLKKAGDGWTAIVDTNNVDNGVRSVLMPTSAIQELALGGRERATVGPRVVKTLLAGDAKSVSLTTDKNLLPTTLGNQSVLVSCLDTTKTSMWVAQANVANFDAAKKELVVSVPTPPAKGLIRLIVRGTGPNPVLGTDLTPFAGPGSTRPTEHDGVDFVFTVRRN